VLVTIPGEPPYFSSRRFRYSASDVPVASSHSLLKRRKRIVSSAVIACPLSLKSVLRPENPPPAAEISQVRRFSFRHSVHRVPNHRTGPYHWSGV